MNKLQAPQDLVDEILDVVDGERLSGVDDAVKIGFHQLLHNVHVIEFLGVLRWGNKIDYVYDLCVDLFERGWFLQCIGAGM